jgi:hypothetical protein
LLAIARGTGKVRWLNQLNRYRKEKKRKGPIFWVGPVLAGNRLWVANTEGELAYADPSEGTLTQYAKFKEAVSLAPVVANQTLYVLDDGGTITAYR